MLPLFLLYQLGVLFSGGHSQRRGLHHQRDVVGSRRGAWPATSGSTLLVLVAFPSAALEAARQRQAAPEDLAGDCSLRAPCTPFFFGGAVVQLMSVFGARRQRSPRAPALWAR